MRSNTHDRNAHHSYPDCNAYRSPNHPPDPRAYHPAPPYPIANAAPPYYYAAYQPQSYGVMQAPLHPNPTQQPPPYYCPPSYSMTQWAPQYPPHLTTGSRPANQRPNGAPYNCNNPQWHCEPCDKSFTIQTQYHAHCKTHVHCEAPDCNFEGSKRIVSAHFQTKHGKYNGDGFQEVDIEGQKFTVLVGNSPEDIAKWRDDRRKRWPKYGTPQKHALENLGEIEDGEVEDAEQPGVVEANSGTVQSEGPKNSVKKTRLCRKFCRGHCTSGDSCHYRHDRQNFPCTALARKNECPKGDSCPFSHDKDLMIRAQSQAASKRKSKRCLKQDAKAAKRHCNGGNGLVSKAPTLLQKLLQKDVDSDHARMLEIIRLLVQENLLTPSSDEHHKSSDDAVEGL